MKVYALSLLSVTAAHPAQATLLGTAQDLNSFSFYQRGSVGEFMTFFTKVSGRQLETLGSYTALGRPGCSLLTPQTVAERTPANQPSSVEENNYKAHVFRMTGRGGGPGLAGESECHVSSFITARH